MNLAAADHCISWTLPAASPCISSETSTELTLLRLMADMNEDWQDLPPDKYKEFDSIDFSAPLGCGKISSMNVYFRISPIQP